MKVKVAQLCPTLWDPWTGILQAPFPSPGDLLNPGIKPRSLALQEDSLPAEPQGKPMNTRVGSLSLLRRIFLTQEWNQGLLLCRWILYQLSYQGSPKALKLYIRKIMQVNYSIAWGRNFTVCLKSYLEYLWLLYVTNPSSSLRTGSHSVSLPCLSS